MEREILVMKKKKKITRKTKNLTTEKKFSQQKKNSHNKKTLTVEKKFSQQKKTSHNKKETLTTVKKILKTKKIITAVKKFSWW